jgi:taurine dioxygenase
MRAAKADGVDAEAVAYVTASGLQVRRLEPAIGAVVGGVDLTKLLSGDVAEDIRQALWAHGVIFFEDQPIDYEGHLRLTRLFGEPIRDSGHADRPEVAVFKTDSRSPGDVAGNWHTDGTYAAAPPIASILRAVKAAELGGDTWYASATAAYDGLPQEVKDQIAPLRCRASIAYATRLTSDHARAAEMAALYPPVEHPVVRAHPVTGRPCLYVNESHTYEIVGMENEEGQALLAYLIRQFTRPEYQVGWSWRDNSIAIWDNAAVQHYAVPGHVGFRHMERTKAAGAPTVGVSEAAAA